MTKDKKLKRPFDAIFEQAAAERMRAERAALGFPDNSAEVEQCHAEAQAEALASRAWANGEGPKPPSPLERMRARKTELTRGKPTYIDDALAESMAYRRKGGKLM